MTNIILISGKQGSGKTTLADGLKNTLEANGHKVYRSRFAKALYEMHNAARDVGRSYGINFPDKIGPLLQYIGTDLVRNNYGEDSWVNCLKTELKNIDDRYSAVIIDDCRFENEVKAFDNSHLYRVFKIRLVADKDTRKMRADGWRDNDSHPSEIGLDNYPDWDLIVNTDVVGREEALDLVLRYLPFYNYVR